MSCMVSISCLFCKEEITYSSPAAIRYENHLVSEHRILTFPLDKLILLTLKLQNQEQYNRLRCDEIKDVETQTEDLLIADKCLQVDVVYIPPYPEPDKKPIHLPNLESWEDKPGPPLLNKSDFYSFLEQGKRLSSYYAEERKISLNGSDQPSVCKETYGRLSSASQVSQDRESRAYCDSDGHLSRISFGSEDGQSSSDLDKSENLPVSSSKRSLSCTSEDERSSSQGRKRSRAEKVCPKCGSVFDQIFDFESHQILCYNKHRSSSKPSKPSQSSTLQNTALHTNPGNLTRSSSLDNLDFEPSSGKPVSKPSSGKPNHNSRTFNVESSLEDLGSKPVSKSIPNTSTYVLTDRCKFLCKLCGDESSKWYRCSHLQEKHQTTIEDYTSRFGETLVNKIHECLVCGNRMYWMRGTIKRHVKSIHNMLIENYEEKYKDQILLQESEEVFSCDICDKTYSSSYNMKRHKRRVHKKRLETKELSTPRMNLDLENDFGDQIFPRSSVLKNHMTASSPTSSKKGAKKAFRSEWYNRYGYECAKCKVQFSYKGNLTAHIKTIHKMSVDEYNSTYGEMKSTHIFICKICCEGMSWSTKHIKAHLDTRHCLSLDNYKDIYVDTSDPEPASEKDYQALEVTTKDARNSKVGVAIPEMVISEINTVLNSVTALSPTSLSPIRPVSVSISRMDKSIVDQHLEDTNSPKDYSNLSKQDLGKCLNSAIESWFSTPEPNPCRENYEEQEELNRPYRCPTCSFCSSEREDLKLHIQDLHSRLPDGASCCGAKFFTRWNLFLHLNSIHSENSSLFSQNSFSTEEIPLLRGCVKSKPILASNSNLDTSEEALRPSVMRSLVIGTNLKINVINSACTENSINKTNHIPDTDNGTIYHKQNFQFKNSNSKSDNIDDLLDGDLSDSDNIYQSQIFSTSSPSLYDNYAEDVAYEDNDVGDLVSPHQIWANGSTYECKACDNFCIRDQKEFMKHIKERHGLAGIKVYRAEFGDPLSDLRTIDCKICGGRMIHEFSKIHSHLYKHHKRTSVQDYYENHVLYPGRNERVNGKDVPSQDLEPNFEEAEETVSDYKTWSNKCRMDCKHQGCNFSTNQHQVFRLHVLSVHSQLFEEYSEKYNLSPPCGWSILVYLKCQLCSSKVPNSQETLDSHMVERHGLSGLDYFNSYIQKAGVEVFDDQLSDEIID